MLAASRSDLPPGPKYRGSGGFPHPDSGEGSPLGTSLGSVCVSPTDGSGVSPLKVLSWTTGRVARPCSLSSCVRHVSCCG